MSEDDRWLLPEGIEEVLPEEARRLESLRQKILGLFDCWGYDLVMPPMIEYLESLLTGVGSDMELQTFKITDLISGRMMGIRPDMTPQAARIDAHYLKQDGITRLCYLGPVLLTRGNQFAGSREPIQFGAELFGHNGVESDVETLSLMATTLETIGIGGLHIELGHVGVFRGLAAAAGLSSAQESQLFAAIQRKAGPDVGSMLAEWKINKGYSSQLMSLVELNGDDSILDKAASVFKKAPADVQNALAELKAVANAVSDRLQGLKLYIDLAELTGYGYHTGVVFSAFVPGHGRAIARGGRYDGIGEAFGCARPATGFSADLRELIRLVPAMPINAGGIAAPESSDVSLLEMIAHLRENGERVVVSLPGDNGDGRCDRRLEKQKNKWVVVNR